jgi:hypothetical protein
MAKTDWSKYKEPIGLDDLESRTTCLTDERTCISDRLTQKLCTTALSMGVRKRPQQCSQQSGQPASRPAGRGCVVHT